MRARAAALALSLAVLPGAAAAQGPLDLAGRVERVTARGPVAMPGAAVTLHRIGTGSAGPVDTTRADGRGRFHFRVATPDTAAMYLATATHGGLAYFAAPVRAGAPVTDALIEIFDTTSAPIPVHVTGRHLVVSAPDADGRRSVVEVYELQNDTVVTRVGTRERPAFVAALPADATDPTASQGDFTGEAVARTPAGLAVLAPISPGVRQLAFNYRLPATAFPLTLGLADSASVVEVLLEEPTGQVVAEGLVPQGAVTSEGRSFVRFLGRNLPAGRTIEVRLAPVHGRAGVSWPWLGLLGAAALGAIAWSLRPRRAAAPVVAAPSRVPSDRTAELRAAIEGVSATLASPDTAPSSLDALRTYRAQLQQELDALAPRSGPA